MFLNKNELERNSIPSYDGVACMREKQTNKLTNPARKTRKTGENAEQANRQTKQLFEVIGQ